MRLLSSDAEPLLSRLHQQINAVGQLINRTGKQTLKQPRFDQQLFHTRGKQLPDYYLEIENNFTQLRQEVANQRLSQITFLTERIVQQIAALQRELATLSLRSHEIAVIKHHPTDLYQQLAQHQDYQRRLEDMIRDKESRLASAIQFSDQQKLQQEIAAYEGRLSKCKAAVARIEKNIERYND